MKTFIGNIVTPSGRNYLTAVNGGGPTWIAGVQQNIHLALGGQPNLADGIALGRARRRIWRPIIASR